MKILFSIEAIYFEQTIKAVINKNFSHFSSNRYLQKKLFSYSDVIILLL